eukprot:363045-Chlamydomonas_euryale.AAC.5
MEVQRVAHKTWPRGRTAAAKNAGQSRVSQRGCSGTAGPAAVVRCSESGGRHFFVQATCARGLRSPRWGENTKDAVPRAIRCPQGVLMTGDSGVRGAFTNHFKTLWGGG